MQAQLDPAHGRRVGLVDYRCVAQGAAAITQRMAALHAEGVTLAVVDAIGDDDLRLVAEASAPLKLVVAGSGLAIGIPALHGLGGSTSAAELPPPGGTRAVISGSCSAATNAQGGETSGACVSALGITQLRIGPQIDPGVPWCYAVARNGRARLHLALKSANFGGTVFFGSAFRRL